MKLEFHITYTYMQKLCNKDEIIILVSYVQNKIFMVTEKVMKLEITYTNEKLIIFVLQSQISNYYILEFSFANQQFRFHPHFTLSF